MSLELSPPLRPSMVTLTCPNASPALLLHASYEQEGQSDPPSVSFSSLWSPPLGLDYRVPSLESPSPLGAHILSLDSSPSSPMKGSAHNTQSSSRTGALRALGRSQGESPRERQGWATQLGLLFISARRMRTDAGRRG